MVVPTNISTKEKLLKLIAEREKLEAKISEYGAILAANDNVGLSGPILDNEEYPRGDIDVLEVRNARQQIIRLQNDHKALMERIEQLLHQLHAEAAQTGQQQDLTTPLHADTIQRESSATTIHHTTAFAKINLVSPGSPAEECGLRVDDLIIEFGSINAANFTGELQEIAALISHMQNQKITVKIQRETRVMTIHLIPKTWNGRGLLGCNIVLINTS